MQASEPQFSSEEESDEEELLDWQCVACNKSFRSEAAMANHERCVLPRAPAPHTPFTYQL